MIRRLPILFTWLLVVGMSISSQAISPLEGRIDANSLPQDIVAQPNRVVLENSLPQANEPAISETYHGRSLCLPDIYPDGGGDCLPFGPSATLTRYASQGMILPLRPLPAVAPDPTLSLMDQSYLVVSKGSIPLYASVADAAAHHPSTTLAGGLKYLDKIQKVIQDGITYYMIRTGQWIEAGEAGAGCCIQSGRFQGLIFQQTPRNSFGWIIEETTSRTAPSFIAPKTGRSYHQETIVQIFNVQTVDKTDWYMIGPDEWVDRTSIRQLRLEAKAPEGVDNGRWIEVNLYDQTLSVYDGGQLKFATLIASGMPPFHTRPGLFKIQTKKLLETMSGAFEANRSDYYYLEDVPWTMYYDDARALHGAYWRTRYGYKASHGCVNISPGDAHWLWDWANVGDWVYVWDPSGETPTDPKFYGPGGA